MATIAPVRALSLRHAVLRPYQPLEVMAMLDGADPEAVVIGAVDGSGDVVATGTVTQCPALKGLKKFLAMTGAASAPSGSAGLRVSRLRGMATRPDLRVAVSGWSSWRRWSTTLPTTAAGSVV